MRPDPQFALEGDWRKTMPSTSDLKHAACDAVDAMRAELIGMAQLGRMDKAHEEAELFMVSNPHFTISCWAAFQPFRDETVRKHFVDGYRKAGLPD
jgi:hypothetical protein